MIHYNNEIVLEGTNLLKPKGDFVSSEVIPYIQPTIEISPKRTTILRSTAVENASSGALYTTPTNADFFLTDAFLSLTKDVNATSSYTRLRASVNGTTQTILAIAGITLTVQSGNVAITFNPPIKVDRNTGIDVVNTAAVANICVFAGIGGYLSSD